MFKKDSNRKQLHCIFLIFLFVANSVFAVNSFYNDRERGWYYHEKSDEVKTKIKKPQKEKRSLREMDPDEVLDLLASVQKEMQVRQARFTLEPSVENAKDFLDYQGMMFNNGHLAGEAMQTALIKYPYLDPRIENPVSQQAIKIKTQEENRTNDAKLKEFADNFKLIYFFKADCPYCQEFKPVIEKLIKDYGFSAQAISSDGNKLEGSSITNIIDNGLSSKLGITTYPSLFAYNPQNNIYLPISRGFLPYQDLRNNILHVYNHIVSLAMEESK